MSNLKERLKSGEQVLGTMVTTFVIPDIAKIIQNCGFDFFIVDCEHGSFTTREVANIIAVARSIGMPALVRIPEMRREHALKFMEMGASGLLLPNTETAEQAQMLVSPRVWYWLQTASSPSMTPLHWLHSMALQPSYSPVVAYATRTQ